MSAPAPRKRPAKKAAPAAARRNEASDSDYAVIEQCGVELKIPRSHGRWPLAALDHFSEGNHLQGIKALLGHDQWQALIAAGAVADDLNDLGEKFQDEFGLDQGN
ncbi:hypothetical protein QSJ18_18195 [Gordonia sp. ABSL1-1]|uniref:hypothetical protein n=1 Tax=Gordonia sp. ABSL1-1 TaxID=3053923 RepID=UPI0025725B64|nr:hypothetical protein [Gordonia sp. ABSL1-1]MDL9938681.1 hypothetical protein [Gordonia sp. ABSL1-1]